ncbi:MAG: metallopeptidase TldD-related protein [Acidobacteriota bacterium]
MKKYFVTVLILLAYQVAARAQEPVLMRAMEDEMARSMEELKLDGKEGPYYLSYLVMDSYQLSIRADSGAIIANPENHFRRLSINLRVGDYNLDNSNFLSLGSTSQLSQLLSASASLSIDDNYDVLRRQIWLATDRTYKNALDMLDKKKVSIQNTVQTEERVPDFSKGAATSFFAEEASPAIQKDRWIQTVDKLASLFPAQPLIRKSKVTASVTIKNSYYVNSEGALSYAASRPEELPAVERMQNDIKAMIQDLLTTRSAPVAEDYSGPVLFTGQAAGDLFVQGIARFLSGTKAPLSDREQISSLLGPMSENPFLKRINRRVASNFISMKAIPTLKNYDGRKLLGSYEIDDEGVRGQDVQLIQDGMLKNLLTTRTPVKGFNQSNGHFRGGAPVPSVIHITSTNALSSEDLKQELILAIEDEGLPYGYMVKGLTPPSEVAELAGSNLLAGLRSQSGAPTATQFTLTRPCSVLRVYPDGKEEPVRGIEFRSLNISALRNIVATSDDEIVYNYPANAAGSAASTLGSIAALLGGGMLGGDYYSTVITPSLLINEIDLKKISGNFEKPPIVDPPMAK